MGMYLKLGFILKIKIKIKLPLLDLTILSMKIYVGIYTNI